MEGEQKYHAIYAQVLPGRSQRWLRISSAKASRIPDFYTKLFAFWKDPERRSHSEPALHLDMNDITVNESFFDLFLDESGYFYAVESREHSNVYLIEK